jgi:hypothetical protein
MKLKTFMLSLLALVIFVGCNERQLIPDLDSNASYMTVKLISPTDALTKGTPGGFVAGTANEGKINNAHFYFYDVLGNYVVEGETLSNLGTTTNPVGSNVERHTDVTIVLKNVTVLPDQMLVVLNLPADKLTLFPGKSLTQAQAQLSDIYWNANDSFIMTSSTYLDGTTVVSTTRNISGHLKKTEAEAVANPVSAYVERLAVKGSLTMGDPAGTNPDMPNVFPCTTPVKAPFQGGDQDVTIYINGWGFSNLNKQSYYIKKIDAGWNFTWTWNATANFRSHWAQDPNYTDGVYPTNFADLRDTGSGDLITPATASLIYKAYNQIASTTWRTADYCQENTIAGDLLTGNRYMNAATNILVAAQMKRTTASETDYVTLYRFNGIFYTWAQYSAQLATQLNLSYQKTDGTAYTAADFQIPDPENASTCTNLYDGEIKPLFTAGAAKLSTPDAIKYLAGERFITEVFTEGRMYYSIPIEHFLNPTYNKTNPSDPFLVGDFGVVRNHYYRVTVTDIKNIGIGVFDVKEPIVPNYDPSTYYLAAQLNILAWQTVTQNVEL